MGWNFKFFFFCKSTAPNPSALASQCNSVSSLGSKIAKIDFSTIFDFKSSNDSISFSPNLNSTPLRKRSYRGLASKENFSMYLRNQEVNPRKLCTSHTFLGTGKYTTASIPLPVGLMRFSLISEPRNTIFVNRNLHLSDLNSSLFSTNISNNLFKTIK